MFDLGKLPEQGTIASVLVTAIITAIVVGVFGKKAAESVLNVVLVPFRFVFDFLYRKIAPRNPLSLSMWIYRAHILRSDLAQMESPVGFALKVPLEYAFAPLKLTSNAAEDRIDLFAHLAANTRCVVLGGPGTGKTTLMKNVVTSVAKRRCHEALNDLIPAFIVLRDLAKAQHTVQQAIVAAFANYHFPGADKFVESSLDAGLMIIILDGLDEVGANRDFVVSQIVQFCKFDIQRETPNRLLVTCREHSYRSRDLHNEIPDVLQVEPFANHHMRVFLEGWPLYKGKSAISLFSMIQLDPQIRDICRNPLLLTILTGLFLDTDRFELPSSRERFYQSAIDELLVQRPARRQMVQQFKTDDKRQILERVALERLETVDRADDPEELTRESIQKKADEVLKAEKFNFHDLLKELTEVNGIIKPTREGSFSCAHRTILEYFAAREALRIRETEHVLTTFTKRTELIEVLYFYCALLRNLPALRVIVEAFIRDEKGFEAARCLLYMQEVPDGHLVSTVSGLLSDSILKGVELRGPLDALSSLASRRGNEFDDARRVFALAIDHLTDGSAAGASALETAIAASPEIALKLIPGLLKHDSERWKLAGVQLLRDVGTEEAIDQLVELLASADGFVRQRAAAALAEMVRSRTRDLRKRALLLPQREDPNIWPLESYFPGRVAIPIAEALAPADNSSSEPINCAVRAINAKIKGADKSGLTRKWTRVIFHESCRRWRLRVGRILMAAGTFLWFLTLAALVGMQMLPYATGKGILISASGPQVVTLDLSLMRGVERAAEGALSDIERLYPAEPLGWARVLPWNWAASPAIPPERREQFYMLRRWSEGMFDPIAVSRGGESSKELSNFLSPEAMVKLQLAVGSLVAKVSDYKNERYLSINSPHPAEIFNTLLVMFMLIFTSYYYRWIKIREIENSSSVNNSMNRLLGRLLFALTVFVPISIGFTTTKGTSWMLYWVMGGIACLFLIGFMLRRIKWPNNPYLVLIDEVRPNIS